MCGVKTHDNSGLWTLCKCWKYLQATTDNNTVGFTYLIFMRASNRNYSGAEKKKKKPTQNSRADL